MAFPIALIAGVAGNMMGGALGGVLGGAAGGGLAGGAFQAALNQATSAQLEEKMIEGAVSVMGGLMMRHAGEVLNAGMEDDGE